MFEYQGNIHIHSKYSDGEGTIDEIAQAAKKANLDFIIITDHFNLKGITNKEQGYIDDVLVLIGMECNDTANHYLALDITEVVPNNTNKPQEVIDNVNRQNGIGIMAHPIEKGSPLYEDNKTYEWHDWEAYDFQGIEVWNFLSQWRDGIKNIFNALYLYVNPHPALVGPYKQLLSIVDNYQTNGRDIWLFGGSDAHATTVKVGPFKLIFSPYELCFRCINMHVLTTDRLKGNLDYDKQLVYKALKNGCSWISYDYFKNSRGFRFNLISSNKTWDIGDKAKYEEGMFFQIKTPYQAKVSLIYNGEIYKTSIGCEHLFSSLKKGVYRVECYQKQYNKYRPWIFSNYIRII